MPSIVVTILWVVNNRMIKTKQAAMITPLILSSWIDFCVGIQPHASYDVWKIVLAVTGSFDYHCLVKSSHFLSSVSLMLSLSVFLTPDYAEICMKVILSSTMPTFYWSLAILPACVVLSH